MPVDPARYVTFCLLMVVLALTPGPANLFAIATGMARGARTALIGVAGMNLATLVWFAAAALGLSALEAAFPLAFRVLRWVGVAYLLWLGGKALLAAATRAPAAASAARGREGSAFWSGFAVQITNPKALLFFTAVLPPFVDTGRPVTPQLALFAVAAIGFDVLAMSLYGAGGAALSRALAQPWAARAFNAAVGVLLLSAAALILWEGG